MGCVFDVDITGARIRLKDMNKPNAAAKTAYSFLGITDETTVCECCGKKNLKCTVVLEDESGNLVRFGRDCASRALGWGLNATKAEARARDRMLVEMQRNAYRTGRPHEQRQATWNGKSLNGKSIVTFHKMTGPVELVMLGCRIPSDNADGWVELVRGCWYYRSLPPVAA